MYPPTIVHKLTPNRGGKRASTIGFVIHSTRGGLDDQALEYSSTVNWFLNPASQASSHIVIGPTGEITEMVPLEVVAWTQGYMNDRYAAVELAQGKLGGPITTAQMQSLAWYLKTVFFTAYPNLTPSKYTLPYHSELDQGIAEGKSDLFSRGAADGIAWRTALLKLL